MNDLVILYYLTIVKENEIYCFLLIVTSFPCLDKF